MRRQPITIAQRARIWLAAALYAAAVVGVYAWTFTTFFGATR